MRKKDPENRKLDPENRKWGTESMTWDPENRKGTQKTENKIVNAP